MIFEAGLVFFGKISIAFKSFKFGLGLILDARNSKVELILGPVEIQASTYYVKGFCSHRKNFGAYLTNINLDNYPLIGSEHSH